MLSSFSAILLHAVNDTDFGFCSLGHDGEWSTFSVNVGTEPPQPVYLLASTQQSSTWVIADAGCSGLDDDCAEARGGLFDSTESNSWFRKDVYQLNEAVELGYGGNKNNGTYGFDTLGLMGQEGAADVIVENQVVAGISTDTFYLGSLGLSPKNVSFAQSQDSADSLLTSLKAQGLIPSLSFGYTAGARYRTLRKSTRWRMLMVSR